MRRFEWILLLSLVVSTGLLAMAPWWIMNPARAQTQSEMNRVYVARRVECGLFFHRTFATGALLCLRR
ncbi:MAG: hypothetical protein R2748_13725 [Bryobacterales bacterium]